MGLAVVIPDILVLCQGIKPVDRIRLIILTKLDDIINLVVLWFSDTHHNTSDNNISLVHILYKVKLVVDLVGHKILFTSSLVEFLSGSNNLHIDITMKLNGVQGVCRSHDLPQLQKLVIGKGKSVILESLNLGVRKVLLERRSGIQAVNKVLMLLIRKLGESVNRTVVKNLGKDSVGVHVVCSLVLRVGGWIIALLPAAVKRLPRSADGISNNPKSNLPSCHAVMPKRMMQYRLPLDQTQHEQ